MQCKTTIIAIATFLDFIMAGYQDRTVIPALAGDTAK